MPELRRVGLAERHQPASRKRCGQVAVHRGAEVGLLERPHPHVQRRPASAAPRSLSRNGTPLNGPSGSSPAAASRASSKSGWMTALSSRVERLDAARSPPRPARRARLAAAHQLGLRGRVERCQLVVVMRPSLLLVRAGLEPDGEAVGQLRRLGAREQHPGHERAARSIESWRIDSVWPSPPKITSWWATRPGKPYRVDRLVDVAARLANQLGGALRRARGGVELAVVVQLDDLRTPACGGRLGGELHHQHRADREVRGDEDVRPAAARACRRSQLRRGRSRCVPTTA